MRFSVPAFRLDTLISWTLTQVCHRNRLRKPDEVIAYCIGFNEFTVDPASPMNWACATVAWPGLETNRRGLWKPGAGLRRRGAFHQPVRVYHLGSFDRMPLSKASHDVSVHFWIHYELWNLGRYRGLPCFQYLPIIWPFVLNLHLDILQMWGLLRPMLSRWTRKLCMSATSCRLILGRG